MERTIYVVLPITASSWQWQRLPRQREGLLSMHIHTDKNSTAVAARQAVEPPALIDLCVCRQRATGLYAAARLDCMRKIYGSMPVSGDNYVAVDTPAPSTAHNGDGLNSFSNSEKFGIKAALIIGLGGFVFGYNIGVIAGALDLLERNFHLSDVEAGLVVGFLPLGSIAGCICGGPFCDKFGRWVTVQVQNLLFVTAAVVLASAGSIEALYCGRFIAGIGAALCTVADIPYLSESSKIQHRGRICSSFEIMIVTGILASFLSALPARELHNGWRGLFLAPALFAMLQSCLMLLLPESPRWLLQKGYVEKAREALKASLDTVDEVNSTLQNFASSENDVTVTLHDLGMKEGCELVTGVDQQLVKVPSSPQRSGCNPDVTETDTLFFLNAPTYRPYCAPMVLVVLLMVFQHFTGGVVVRNYATHIFKSAGYGSDLAMRFTCALGAVKMAVTSWASLHVDKWGRRPLLLAGIALIGSGMGVLTVAFVCGVGGGQAEERGWWADIAVGVYICACSLVTAGYSLGFGPVSWLLQSEMFPVAVRGRAMAASVIVSNCAEFLANTSFLPLLAVLHNSGTFMLYFCICVLGFVYVYVAIVETKAKEPEDVLLDLQHNLRGTLGWSYLVVPLRRSSGSQKYIHLRGA